MPEYRSDSKPIGALRVAELARAADVTPATVRYYSRIGLLSPRREPENGYRCFSSADRRRVMFIRRAQALGLTISDIKVILESVDQGDAPCHQVRVRVEGRLRSVQEQLAQLHETEARISQALTAWEDMEDSRPTDGELCPLIDRVVDLNERPAFAGGQYRTTRDRCSRARSFGPDSPVLAHC